MNEGTIKTNHVIFKTQDGQLHEIYYRRKKGWSYSNLSSRCNATPAEGNPSGYRYRHLKTHHIMYRGNDNHIHEMFFKRGDGWKHSNISGQVGAPQSVGNPFGYTYHVFNSQQVVYRTQNNQIHELYWVPGKGWRHSSITERANAPLASSDPTAYIWNDQNHVIYRGADGHIHELFYVRGKDWRTSNLTASTNAPPAAYSPIGQSFHVYDSQHVFYVAQNGHIQEIFYTSGKGWRTSDLTARAGATPAIGKLACYVWRDQNHVVFKGTDNNIHELFFIRGQEWKHTNLSQKVGTPQAVSNPVGYTFDEFNSQHVMYNGADGNIYELFYVEGKGWRTTNLTQTTNAPTPSGDLTAYTYELE